MLSKVEISHKTIIFTVVFLASIWLVLQIRDILFLMFIAFIIMSGLRPFVDFLEKHRIPRVAGVLLSYLLLIAFIVVSLVITIPALANQLNRLVQDLPVFLSNVVPFEDLDINAFSQQIAPIGENLVKFTVNMFSNVLTVVTVFIFSFYFLLERKHAGKYLSGLIGEGRAKETMKVLERIETRLGGWIQGELILMLLIGVFTYIGLLLLHIDFALSLGIIAGLLEIVPTIGPIISAIPAVLVALAISPLSAVSVVVLFIIIHQLENGFVVPLVMKKSVGLSPLVTIFALLVGGKLAGITGAVLSVPVVLVVNELLRAYTKER